MFNVLASYGWLTSLNKYLNWCEILTLLIFYHRSENFWTFNKYIKAILQRKNSKHSINNNQHITYTSFSYIHC